MIERDAPGFQRRCGPRACATADGAARRAASPGIAGRTLIVNFPGSPRAIDQLFPRADAGAGATPPRRWVARVAARRRPLSSTGSSRRYGERPALDGVTLTLAGRGDARRLRAQRRGQVDAAARAGHAAAPARRHRCACSATTLPREGWAVRGRIGLLGHDPLLYRDLSARENLASTRACTASPPARVGRAAGGRRPDAAAPTTRVHTFSRGMVQRAGGLPRGPARPRAAPARRAAREPRPGGRRARRAAGRAPRAARTRVVTCTTRRAAWPRPTSRSGCAPGARSSWRARGRRSSHASRSGRCTA